MLSGGHWDISLAIEEIETAGDLALVHSRYGIALTLNDGPGSPIMDRGHVLTLWQRGEGGWRIRYDMAVSEVPRPPARGTGNP
jgi:ketosteroid isomerase-like protein